jgi:hypothetical protein
MLSTYRIEFFHKPSPINTYQIRDKIPPIIAKIIASSNKVSMKDDMASKINKNELPISPMIPVDFFRTFPLSMIIEKNIPPISSIKNPGNVPGV